MSFLLYFVCVLQGHSYIYAKTLSAYTFGPNLWDESITVLMELAILCIKCVRGNKINLYKSNFDRICDEFSITSSKTPFDDLSPINAK